MRRYRALLIGLLIVAAISGGLWGLFWGLQQVPDFYETALETAPEPAIRQESARTFEQRTMRLVDGIQNADQWAEEFTETQINSWLTVELHPKYGRVLPEGVSNPRVELSKDSLSIGFHYEQKTWNGVVSVRVRPWVPQPNQLAFEIESIRAGLIPIPLEHILHELGEHLTTEGLQVEWSTLNGNDVVILHLGKVTEGEPVLEAVQAIENAIRVAGRRGVPKPVDTSPQDVLPSGADESNAAAKRISISRDVTTE